MSVVIKVAPDVLKHQAEAVKGDISGIQNEFTKLGDVIRLTKGYWEGEASRLHQTYYEDNKDDAEKIIKRLKEHP